MSQGRPRHRFEWGLVLGLGLGVLGALAVGYWLRRRNSQFGIALPPQPTLELAGRPVVADSEDNRYTKAPLPATRNARTTIRSYTLPAPGAQAIRIVSSADRPYNVMLRVVNPAGSFGMFSFDAAALNNTTAIPTGENIIIPVGQWQTVPLPPYSALYGRGSVANVVVSVAGSPVGPSALRSQDAAEIETAFDLVKVAR